MDSNELTLLAEVANRILGPKAEIGFLQEADPVTGQITNSSTRLIQVIALLFFPFHLDRVYDYLEKRNGIDLSDVAALFVMLIVHVVVIVAPKVLKNTVVVQAMLNAIGKGEKK